MSLFGWMMCAKGGSREGFLFGRDRQDRSSRRRFGYFVYVTRETRRERHGSGERASAGVCWLGLVLVSLGLERAFCVVKVVTKAAACGDGAAGVGS